MSSGKNLNIAVTALNRHLTAALKASTLLAKVRVEGRIEPGRERRGDLDNQL